MAIVIVGLHNSWKWVVSTKMQLSYNWIAMNYSIYRVSCNSCNLFDNIHNVEIWWVASHHYNSKTKF
jgi:hypothetical protein